MISNFLEIRRDGKVIPEGMTGLQMLTAGWEPGKVIRLQWDFDGRPIELTSPFGLLSRIVPSREYIAVLEDTDATGYYAILSIYLPDGTLRKTLSNIVDFPEIPRFPAHTEPGEFLWFQRPVSPLPTAFAAVFRITRNNATFQIDIDAATYAVLGTKEVR